MSGLMRFGAVGLLCAAAAGLCPAQMPPSESVNYAARVVTLTGQVSVLRDNQPWALNVGDQVLVKQVIVSGPDGHALFQVSDGSTFEVFPDSNVIFRQNPPNWRNFLEVLVGRVRIHIQKLGAQPNPNKVYTPTAVISVRGTTFDVSVSDADETTMVEVEEGEVAVQHALLPTGDPKILHAGESIAVYKTTPLDAHLIDRGTIIHQGLRSLLDALATAVDRTRTGGSGSGGGGGIPGGAGGGTGDTGKPGTSGGTGGSAGGTGSGTPPVPAPPPPPPSSTGGH